VLVLGAGHGGLLAIAAAREAVGGEGTVAAVDVSPTALARARAIDPAPVAVEADVTDPLAVVRGLDQSEVGRADLTLLCTSVPGAEGTVLLASAVRATIVFFSTATRFVAAALGADGYALELLRRLPPLQAAFAA
jgi:L-erythro-3,5-diaminohexanoate dehydrogenase